MEWFTGWETMSYPMPDVEIEAVDSPADAGMLTAWLIVSIIVLAATVFWYRQRVVRHSFWCADAGLDVEVRLRCGCVLSCAVFEDPRAIGCARRCLDRSFRVQWPPALPVPARRRSGVDWEDRTCSR
jgi:hypothetical protein